MGSCIIFSIICLPLLLFLIAVGIYVYVVIYKNQTFFSNQRQSQDEDQDSEKEDSPKKVHFSDKNEQFIIPNRDQQRQMQIQYHNQILQQQQQHQQQQQQQQQQSHQQQPPQQQPQNEINLKLQPIDRIDLSEENLYDDIFIVNPMEIKNTNLTLSENEYFNNM